MRPDFSLQHFVRRWFNLLDFVLDSSVARNRIGQLITAMINSALRC
jgi:hypothetical protein